MLDLSAQFATDPELEIKGAWVPGPGKKGEFLIARAGNRKFQRMLTEEIEEHQEILDGKDDAADRCSDEIMGRVMAATILLGWRGEVGFDGVKAEYSTALAAQKLAEMKDFRDWVNKQADKREQYRKKAEKALGNA